MERTEESPKTTKAVRNQNIIQNNKKKCPNNETFNRKHFDIIMHAEPETKLSNLNLLCKIFKDNTLI